MAKRRLINGPVYLGVEGGGTRTVALLCDGDGDVRARWEGGPMNWRVAGAATVGRLLRRLRQDLRSSGEPACVGVFLAGARTGEDVEALRGVVGRTWPRASTIVGSDLDSAVRAAARGGSSRGAGSRPCVLVLSGTGSCTYGLDGEGRGIKVGGWGHSLGDRGSGYAVALQGLRDGIVRRWDREGEGGELGRSILGELGLESPEGLIDWIAGAGKPDVARLAPQVIAASLSGDRIAREVIEFQAQELAADAVVCARRVAGGGGGAVDFLCAGGMLQRQEAYREAVIRKIRRMRGHRRDRFVVLDRETAWGAVEAARSLVGVRTTCGKGAGAGTGTGTRSDRAVEIIRSTTEERHPRSGNLDRMPLRGAIRLMLSEEARVAGAIARECSRIEAVVRRAAAALSRGGRLFYVGAGTSGRLGVLDASECPPTFGTPPGWVQGIMAGGVGALTSAVEGAEDDEGGGAEAVKRRRVGERDVVVGLAASGRTPFVRGALREAASRGAWTALVCCNPRFELPEGFSPKVVIRVATGPEVLTGSTRLKAGTATKIILNVISTLAMVRLGKVVSNLMIDVKASNAKLRGRAVRIVAELAGVDEAEALRRLEAAGWSVAAALGRRDRVRGRVAR